MNRAAILLLLFVPAYEFGDEWPCFGGGPSRNMVNPAKVNVAAK